MANKNPDTSGLKPPFSKDNQPKNRGRKPSRVKAYIEDNGLNHNDVASMAKYILPLSEEELDKIQNDQEVPFMIRLFAKAIVTDMERGYLDNVMKIMDRAVGKPQERMEHSGELATTTETREEKQKRIKELLEKGKDNE